MVKLTTALIAAENEGTQPSSIVSLHLPRRDLHEVSGLDVCEKLVRLDLSNNHLSNLEGLSMCKNLKWLSISGNLLTSLKGVEGLLQLSVLNASRNELSCMDEVAGLVELRALILNDNQISSICRLDNLSSMNTLVLSRNPIHNLGKALSKNFSLTKLSLSNCCLQVLGACLKRCVELKELRLAHNQLLTLPRELERNEQLHILDVGNNHLRSWPDVEALRTLHNLANLNLRGNPLCTCDDYQKEVKRLVPNLQVFDGRPLQAVPSKQWKSNSKANVEFKEVRGQEGDTSPAGINGVEFKMKTAQQLKAQKLSRKKSNKEVQRQGIESINQDDESKPFLEFVASVDEPEEESQPVSKRYKENSKQSGSLQQPVDSGVVAIADGKSFNHLNSMKLKKLGPSFLQNLEEANIGTGGPSSWDADPSPSLFSKASSTKEKHTNTMNSNPSYSGRKLNSNR